MERENRYVEEYAVNENTMAILPYYSADYQSVVYETNATYYVKNFTNEIIEQACLEGGASYEGRREATVSKLGIQKKVPVAINTNRNVFAFPTCSPTKFNCNWLFFHFIQEVRKDPSKRNHCSIQFKNKQILNLPASYHVIEKQYARAALCVNRFSK